uniref:FAD dependent oxidoreductase domain-containing protein n=1 Tax=Ditylenchus dipsaci TaxID=166011 RepID=A0A915DS15_9BILA
MFTTSLTKRHRDDRLSKMLHIYKSNWDLNCFGYKRRISSAQLTIFGDRPFKDTCSYGPAGLWGPHYEHKENRKWAEISFNRFAKLQKNNKEDIEKEERLVSNVAYNFKWLKEAEVNCCYPINKDMRVITPVMPQKTLKITSIQDFVNSREGSNFDVLINCAGLQGGKLAGDDDTVYPIRGVLLEVDLPYQKHFRFNLIKNNSLVPTYVIPMVNSVLLGGLFQQNRSDLEITDEDRQDIWRRNVELQPSLQNSNEKTLSEWCGLRPGRPTVRLEHCIYDTVKKEKIHVIHNYGHSSNGFTLAWGCAQDVVKMVAGIFGPSKS